MPRPHLNSLASKTPPPHPQFLKRFRCHTRAEQINLIRKPTYRKLWHAPGALDLVEWYNAPHYVSIHGAGTGGGSIGHHCPGVTPHHGAGVAVDAFEARGLHDIKQKHSYQRTITFFWKKTLVISMKEHWIIAQDKVSSNWQLAFNQEGRSHCEGW